MLLGNNGLVGKYGLILAGQEWIDFSWARIDCLLLSKSGFFMGR